MTHTEVGFIISECVKKKNRNYTVSDLHLLKSLLHYDPTTGNFTWLVKRRGSKGLGSVAGSVNTHHISGKRYVFIHTCGKQWRAHRLAWLFMKGEECPSEIDHINGDGTDNRWCNLRQADSTENSRNQRRRNTNAYSNVMGVRWYKPSKKWVASIHHNGKNVHLGLFEDFSLAVEARKIAEKKYGYHKNHGKNRPL